MRIPLKSKGGAFSVFTRRRVLSAAVGGASCSVLGACGRSAATSGTPAGSAGVPPGTPSKTPITVTVWHGGNANTERGHELLRVFEQAQPHVTVDWRAVEWSGATQMLQRLPIAAASGDLPDTFRGHWSNFGNVIHQQWVRPLDAYMKQAGVRAADFTPSTWALSSYRGQVYAMPSYAYTLAPLWNRDQLRRNGLPVDRLPATFDQVMETSTRVMRTGQPGEAGQAVQMAGAADGTGAQGAPPVTDLGWTHRSSTPGHFVFLFGAQVYDAARERVTPEHPGVIEALHWLLQLDKRQGGYQRIEQFFAAAGATPFYTGRLAVSTLQPRSFSELSRLAPDLDFGVSFYPSKTGSRPEVANASVQAEMLPIARASKHPDETWALLHWLHVERAAEWAWRTLNTPCLVGALDAFYEHAVTESFGSDRRLVPFLDVYKEMSRRGTAAWPTIPTSLEYLDAFTKAWNDVLQEKTTPEVAMKDVSRIQQGALEQALATK
jgi:ABC-type glycerol-3-phosphate transport system substrate-binding protein